MNFYYLSDNLDTADAQIAAIEEQYHASSEYQAGIKANRERMQNLSKEWDNAAICPHCGDRAGFSMGTGDCGCEVDPE